MTYLLRVALVSLLALWLASPTTGSEGGENGGGTGVWILPACVPMPETTLTGTQFRASHVVASVANDVVLRTSNEMGATVATFTDELSGTPVALTVVGHNVRCPRAALEALANSPLPSATIVCTDADQRGYVILVRVDPATGKVTFRVR